MSKLYDEYGCVLVPKGTLLFRQGEVVPEYGAFFALCPFYAISFEPSNGYEGGKINAEQQVYEVKEDIKLIFLAKHLDSRGFPITSIDLAYKSLTGELTLRNDLDIKWRNLELKRKFHALLMSEGIIGWLSTIENYEPLELFILPNAIDKILIRTDLNIKDFESYNALSQIEVFPTSNFITSSFNNLKRNIEFILDRSHRKRDMFYSVIDKVFIETNLLLQLMQRLNNSES